MCASLRKAPWWVRNWLRKRLASAKDIPQHLLDLPRQCPGPLAPNARLIPEHELEMQARQGHAVPVLSPDIMPGEIPTRTARPSYFQCVTDDDSHSRIF